MSDALTFELPPALVEAVAERVLEECHPPVAEASAELRYTLARDEATRSLRLPPVVPGAPEGTA
jgi:hypothetical protein